MTATYEKIATTTLGGSAASTTFNSISGSYTDLVLIVAGVTTSGTEAVAVQVNGDTGSNYSRTVLLGNGSAASSSRATSQTSAGLGVIDSATQGNTIYHFMNYSNATTYKTFIARGNVASEQTRVAVGLWRSTSAITSITVLVGTTFATGCTFTLYGIKAE
jgi:hypothetical protein